MKSTINILIINLLLISILYILPGCTKYRDSYSYDELVEIFATISHYFSWDFQYRLPVIKKYDLDEKFNQDSYLNALMTYQNDLPKWRQLIHDGVKYFIDNFVSTINEPVIKYYMADEFSDAKNVFLEATEIDPSTIITVPAYWMVYYFTGINSDEAEFLRPFKVEYYENQKLKYRAIHNHNRVAIYKLYFDEDGNITDEIYTGDDFWNVLDEGYPYILSFEIPAEDLVETDANAEEAPVP